MLRPLFNNPAYPVTDNYQDMPDLLRQPTIRAVALQDTQLMSASAALQNHIRAPETAIARKYVVQAGNDDRETYAGKRNPLYRAYTSLRIRREAAVAGIKIDDAALQLLTDSVNRARVLFTDVYRSMSGDTTSPIASHILFTPKGGAGRTPKIHIDFLPLTGHWAFALAPLDIMQEEPDQAMWDAMNRKKQNALPDDERNKRDHWLSEMADRKQSDFAYTTVGQLIAMKGQRNRDLDNPDDRGQVCVHKSSNLIEHMGQATALFFPRIPRSP